MITRRYPSGRLKANQQAIATSHDFPSEGLGESRTGGQVKKGSIARTVIRRNETKRGEKVSDARSAKI